MLPKSKALNWSFRNFKKVKIPGQFAFQPFKQTIGHFTMRHLVYLFLTLFLSYCGDDSQNCSRQPCTDIFIMVSVEVMDADGNVVGLDSVVTTDEKGTVIYHSTETLADKYYVVVTDTERNLLSPDGSELTFKGWLNDQLEFSEIFLVGKDCCHIRKLEGPEMIVLED